MDVNKQISYTLNLLRPYQVLGHTKRRVGSEHDGGYVILDDVSRIPHVVSLGVAHNMDFDVWFAHQGVKVIQYDTMCAQNSPHDNLIFRAEKLGTAGDQTCFSRILKDNHLQHAHNLILKCDIGGAEWACLSRVDQDWYAHFEQMVFEFHDLHNLRDSGFRDWVFQIWEQIHRTHVVIHVHANNQHAPVWIQGVRVPPVLEVTFVRRDLGVCVPSSEQFPTEWDAPNIPHNSDVRLGTFTFI